MFHVILHRPEIPPNTGNVIRLCANTGCALHLVGPLGFELDRKSVQRAGMDYAEIAQVSVHPDLAQCLARIGPTRLFAIETGCPPPELLVTVNMMSGIFSAPCSISFSSASTSILPLNGT